MKKTHLYSSYEDYIKYQLEKTSDRWRQEKWLGEEWNLKIDIFTELFKTSEDIIRNKKKAICLGSRTGQEVVALQNMGIQDTIGIDLHEFKPYTIIGDIHNLDFPDCTFDLAFSNIFDHSLYPEKFAYETHRVLQKGGIFILHVQIDTKQDEYTETYFESKDPIIELFKDFKLLKEGNIDSGRIAMNYEFIFQK